MNLRGLVAVLLHRIWRECLVSISARVVRDPGPGHGRLSCTGLVSDRTASPDPEHVEARNLSHKACISSASIVRTANASSALFEPGTGRAAYAGAKLKW